MKASRAINFLFLSVAIGWCGFSVAELIYSKLPVGDADVESAAVVALASAAKTRDDLPPVAAGPGSSVLTIEAAPEEATPPTEVLPDPVALGPLKAPTPIVGKDQTSAQPPAVEYEDADLTARNC